MAMPTTTTRTTTTGFALCVRDSDTAPYPALRDVEQAWRACRRRKRATVRACVYEQQLLDNLVDTCQALNDQSWQPAPPVAFVVEKPKTREVYAAQFQDRVVHHWLVPRLDAILDKRFIFDSASNRLNKGTHFAVQRLQDFMRARKARGHFLQPDVRNFFNSVHQPTLLAVLARHLKKAIAREEVSRHEARALYWLAQRIIRQPSARQAIRLGGAEAFARVPVHKRLESAPPDTGLPIGNLTSQFFANVYLNEVDQFVKHELKCRHYVRYVDDMVLLHEDPEQLRRWHVEIRRFLADKLRLQLTPDARLRDINDGVDFLGYIVRPDYRLVRRRVVGNLDDVLVRMQSSLHRPRADGVLLDLLPETREQLRASAASYWGHFKHANSYHLKQKIFARHPWLNALFSDAQALTPTWQPAEPETFSEQWAYFRREFPQHILLMQCGRRLLCSEWLPVWGLLPYTGPARTNCWQLPLRRTYTVTSHLRRSRQAWIFCDEQGYLPGNLKRRVLRHQWTPRSAQTVKPDPVSPELLHHLAGAET